jgi:hypothetical protein
MNQIKGRGQILSQAQLIFSVATCFGLNQSIIASIHHALYDGLIQSAAFIHGKKYNFCSTEDLSFTFY